MIGGWETGTEALEKNSMTVNQVLRDLGKILKSKNCSQSLGNDWRLRNRD
jgi:hypothetical protein